MSHYIWVEPGRFRDAQVSELVDGVRINVALSAYDAPRRVSGDYDEATGDFVIQFDYIDNEPPGRKVTSFNNVKFVEGKISRKLLSIRIPVDEPPHDKACVIQLQTRLIDAMETRGEQFGDKLDLHLNQKAARDVIEHDLGELVGAR